MSALGQSRPGQVSRISAHVRYAPKAEARCRDMPSRVDGDALDVIYSQQHLMVAGAISEKPSVSSLGRANCYTFAPC
jgi:hypothetical protein